MQPKRSAHEAESEAARGPCLWCQQPFEKGHDRRIHVSRLGAPGAFHAACFEEYDAATVEP
jgi:hypothetical protein